MKVFLQEQCTVTFKKTFDTVDHQNMLKKMLSLGIKDTKLSSLKDYLGNRKQCIRINNANSEYLEEKCGVHHGSILDPFYSSCMSMTFQK